MRLWGAVLLTPKCTQLSQVGPCYPSQQLSFKVTLNSSRTFQGPGILWVKPHVVGKVGNAECDFRHPLVQTPVLVAVGSILG